MLIFRYYEIMMIPQTKNSQNWEFFSALILQVVQTEKALPFISS